MADQNYVFKNTNGVSWGLVHTITADDIAQVEAVPEVLKYTVTAGCTVNGNLSVVLRGATPVVIAVTTAADLVGEVATLIQGGTYPGWVATVDGAVVTFTAGTAGVKTGANTVGVASTGVTGTMEVFTVGSDEQINSMIFQTPVMDADLAVVAQFRTTAGVAKAFTGTVVVSAVSAGAVKVTVKDNSTASLIAGDVVTLLADKVYKY